MLLGVSVQTLRAWRSKVSGHHPLVTKVGAMVMYSKKGLEEYVEARTIGNRE